MNVGQNLLKTSVYGVRGVLIVMVLWYENSDRNEAMQNRLCSAVILRPSHH